MSHSVLFRQFPLDHLDALAPVVARTLGVTDFDARTKIRRGWGFLKRDATAEAARQIVDDIGDCAGGCYAVDNAQLHSLAQPRVMTGFAFTESGFTPELTGTKETPRSIEWADAQIIAAGGVAEEVVRREAAGDDQKTGKMMLGLGVFLVTGVPLGIFGGGKKKNAKPVKSNRWLTFGRIVTRQGDQYALNLDHFNFSGLGAKKQLQGIVNFRALIGEWENRAHARLNLGARLVIGNQSLTFAGYAGLHDFETELLWLHNVAER